MRYLTIKDLAKRYGQSLKQLQDNLLSKRYVEKYIISRDINGKPINKCYRPTEETLRLKRVVKFLGGGGNRGVWWYDTNFFDKIFN